MPRTNSPVPISIPTSGGGVAVNGPRSIMKRSSSLQRQGFERERDSCYYDNDNNNNSNYQGNLDSGDRSSSETMNGEMDEKEARHAARRSVTLGSLLASMATINGYLLKQSASGSEWKTRFVVLGDDASLWLFRNNTDHNAPPIARLPVTEVAQVNPAECSSDSMFRVSAHFLNTGSSNNSMPTQTWYLQCTDAESMFMWVRNIVRRLNANSYTPTVTPTSLHSASSSQLSTLSSTTASLSLSRRQSSADNYSQYSNGQSRQSFESIGFRQSIDRFDENNSYVPPMPETMASRVSIDTTASTATTNTGRSAFVPLKSLRRTVSQESTRSSPEEREAQMRAMHKEYVDCQLAANAQKFAQMKQQQKQRQYQETAAAVATTFVKETAAQKKEKEEREAKENAAGIAANFRLIDLFHPAGGVGTENDADIHRTPSPPENGSKKASGKGIKHIFGGFL
ncbi:hypothetical protein HK100_011365 [Physocladia obscura]|uniref:PH domain-containing protein n=1 Tax=Physocladia obscura TaxID=109957 RepID=A0AAD5XGN3_9FUNG|nr:hypothetical protein HK100_011365 [Physocladia obscura]